MVHLKINQVGFVFLPLVYPHLGFPGGASDNQSANAGDTRDMGLIHGSGRSPEEGMATQSGIPAWRIPWTEEPGGLQSIGSQRVDMTEPTQHTCTPWFLHKPNSNTTHTKAV